MPVAAHLPGRDNRKYLQTFLMAPGEQKHPSCPQLTTTALVQNEGEEGEGNARKKPLTRNPRKSNFSTQGLASRIKAEARTRKATTKTSRFDGRGMGLDIRQAGFEASCATRF